MSNHPKMVVEVRFEEGCGPENLTVCEQFEFELIGSHIHVRPMYQSQSPPSSSGAVKSLTQLTAPARGSPFCSGARSPVRSSPPSSLSRESSRITQCIRSSYMSPELRCNRSESMCSTVSDRHKCCELEKTSESPTWNIAKVDEKVPVREARTVKFDCQRCDALSRYFHDDDCLRFNRSTSSKKSEDDFRSPHQKRIGEKDKCLECCRTGSAYRCIFGEEENICDRPTKLYTSSGGTCHHKSTEDLNSLSDQQKQKRGVLDECGSPKKLPEEDVLKESLKRFAECRKRAEQNLEKMNELIDKNATDKKVISKKLNKGETGSSVLNQEDFVKETTRKFMDLAKDRVQISDQLNKNTKNEKDDDFTDDLKKCFADEVKKCLADELKRAAEEAQKIFANEGKKIVAEQAKKTVCEVTKKPVVDEGKKSDKMECDGNICKLKKKSQGKETKTSQLQAETEKNSKPECTVARETSNQKDTERIFLDKLAKHLYENKLKYKVVLAFRRNLERKKEIEATKQTVDVQCWTNSDVLDKHKEVNYEKKISEIKKKEPEVTQKPVTPRRVCETEKKKEKEIVVTKADGTTRKISDDREKKKEDEPIILKALGPTASVRICVDEEHEGRKEHYTYISTCDKKKQNEIRQSAQKERIESQRKETQKDKEMDKCKEKKETERELASFTFEFTAESFNSLFGNKSDIEDESKPDKKKGVQIMGDSSSTFKDTNATKPISAKSSGSTLYSVQLRPTQLSSKTDDNTTTETTSSRTRDLQEGNCSRSEATTVEKKEETQKENKERKHHKTKPNKKLYTFKKVRTGGGGTTK